MKNCPHENFDVLAIVNRILEKEGGEHLRFLGLPMGLDFKGACVDPTGTEARLAARPSSTLFLPDDSPPGFRVIQGRIEHE